MATPILLLVILLQGCASAPGVGPVSITISSLPNGRVNAVYSTTLTASGGNGPYTWAIANGALPSGLTLSPTTGTISGTPTQTVSMDVLTIRVSDASTVPQSAVATLTLTVVAAANITITPTALPNGQVGVAYSQVLNPSGGTAPYTWALTSGTLPAGLNFNNSTGTISGTPTATANATPLTFKVTDTSNPVLTQSTVGLTLTITPATLVITTSSLPNGQVGAAYSATLAATGGTTPYTWTLSSGSLDGLLLNAATGAITGTPTAAVNASPLTFKVTDAGSPTPQTKTVNLTLTIAAPPLVITTTTLPNGQIGVPYNAALAATGGTLPYTWTITAGALPAGLQLNAVTGAIAGTPTAVANATPITFKIVDTGTPAQTKSVNLTLTITPATLAITTTSLPDGQVGSAYNASLAATGGTLPYTWTTTSGTLPSGLQLNAATGAITGLPLLPVNATPLTFKVTDSGAPAQTMSVNLTLTIAPLGLAITTTSLPNGQVGVPYNTALAATGGTTPLTWTITSGTLPDGLHLNAATGAITGTPTIAVVANPLTFKVTDSGLIPQTQSVNLTLTITAVALTITTTSPLPTGVVGTPYNTSLAATGGTLPLTWTITSGGLPANLMLDAASGAITGTPTISVTNSPITFQVADSSVPQLTKSGNFTLSIAASTLTITTATLPDGQAGTAYSGALAASGGIAPYTWALTSGSLDGLALNTATGAITGTPTSPVTASPVSFKVTDSSNPKVSKTVNLTLTVAPPTLSITTTSLPNGQVGTAYNATLAATGGVQPYNWTLMSGSLDGLSLNATTGAITGSPTAAVTASPLTFKVTDSNTPTAGTDTANLTLTVATGSFTVSVSPKRAGLTVSQSVNVTATTTDPAGVNWSSSGGGGFSAGSSLSTVPVTYTAPGSAGVVTLTATSVTDGTTTATVTIGVTDLAGVATYLNDNSRTGQNVKERALTSSAGPTQVNTTNFGKLFSCTVDAAVYAQPLWVANVSIATVSHNVVYVATERDTVYAFDADLNTSPCTPLWSASLLDAAHGGGPGETFVSSTCGDLTPDIGIVGTPVIDLASGTMYVVSKSTRGGTAHQRIHALDITDGSEKFSGPVEISASVPGTGVGSSGGNVAFDALVNNQHPALLLENGHVIISWASHCDNGAYHGWVMSYAASNLAQEGVLNASPDGINAGIWMSGAGPAADASGNIYVVTGNGTFDVTNGSGATDDYGDAIMKLGPPSGGSFPISSYFRSFREPSSPDIPDRDQGSGGILLPPGGELIQSGKDGNIYVADQSNLGGFNGSNNSGLHQEVTGALGGHGIFSTPTYWNGNVYFGANSSPLRAFSYDTGTGMLSGSATSDTSSSRTYPFPGPTAPISANGSSNGIVWTLDNSQYCTNQSPGCGPAVLHAYDATDLSSELWKSSTAAGDAAGNAVKFNVPTVANGKVYVGTRGNNGGSGTSSVNGELDVYGLKP